MSDKDLDMERDSDLEEADRLDATAEALPEGELRNSVKAEADALRKKWAPKEETIKAAIVVSDDLEDRERDLAEASKLEAMAATLREGSKVRTTMETEAAKLRAKWPDFEDDVDGQMKRLVSYLETNGISKSGVVPARAILHHIETLKKDLAALKKPRTCHGCGLPIDGTSAHVENTFLISAIKTFETDAVFRSQVTTGQLMPGQSAHPWIAGSIPHKGPQSSVSPWALPSMAMMIRADASAIKSVGPKLRAALKEKGLSIPALN